MEISIEMCHAESLLSSEIEQINILMRELSLGAGLIQKEYLLEMNRGATIILFARLEGRIIGMGSVVRIQKISGLIALIEDVVVLSEHRGKGIAEKLCRRLISLAQVFGAHYVGLTSSPKREAANRLYRRLGFEIRETNHYRLRL